MEWQQLVGSLTASEGALFLRDLTIRSCLQKNTITYIV